MPTRPLSTWQVAWYVRVPFFAPFIDVLSDLLWFLGEYILFQPNFEGYTTEVNQLGPILQTCVCRSINVSIGQGCRVICPGLRVKCI